jgi:hypothetical protein
MRGYIEHNKKYFYKAFIVIVHEKHHYSTIFLFFRVVHGITGCHDRRRWRVSAPAQGAGDTELSMSGRH